ncbi:SGNH/GDSL hydrolase family protein [Sphingobium sp.]|uniref:SGNH/GDSL hydrolase family protein n=1 Tax=Sphingobium sp. TaxID=1912891 RepID=UPI003BB788E6
MTIVSRVTHAVAHLANGLSALLLAGCAAQSGPAAFSVPVGSIYVAMGSSYAAGPGVTTSADTPPTRCQRSADNYAHQFARQHGLHLVDVSCGGATTAHILGPWKELPPQIEAIPPDARLVTVTIGGNDVGFVGSLMKASCDGQVDLLSSAASAMCGKMAAYAREKPQQFAAMQATADEATWAKLEAAMDSIGEQVKRRAPNARLVFVDYIRIVPAKGCVSAPFNNPVSADTARTIALRLANVTATVARRAGAGLVRASDLSRGHEACTADSWSSGFAPPNGVTNFSPYHPNLAAMTAIAGALDREVGR